MSRKQSVRPRPGKKAGIERKRDERAARRALAKERKNRAGEAGDAEEFVSFTNQLQVLGLRMREVPGDGNCLFRALGDQLEGHSRNHLKHRQETVDYMIRHRDDFEPFVEDDVPFAKHVENLAQPGTFAGNDAIVAFARSNQVNVVIHQLNNPLWQIRGSDKCNVRELHIAYRYGEHYDSVRHINDNAETPSNLQTEMSSKDESNRKGKQKSNPSDERQGDAVQKVRNATGCADVHLILQSLEAESYDIESTIQVILQMEELKHIADIGPDYIAEEGGCYGRPERTGNHGTVSETATGPKAAQPEDTADPRNVPEENKDNQKFSNKQRKEQQRLQKKKRQEEKHRQRVQELRISNMDNNRQEEEDRDAAGVTVVKALTALNI
ncbi:PREDICTED: OTU domain-containing protein 3 [Nanorana parkeri]|uniref:OTU domain-containing protein 3 n=1 Tax=Nanorana parkeri TaxID=125878 RepID=UPI0008543277|nr:PREDICTED: OTU domain-containing protein 3 [Nanorana parkeri]